MFDTILEHPEMAAEINESGALIDQLEFDPAHIARILATALFEIFNRDFGKGRCLFTCEFAEIEVRVTVCPGSHVILHVGEA